MTATGAGIAVVKVGGGLLDIPGALGRVVEALATAARDHRLLIVPGGGPFADAVRTFDAGAGLSPVAAHWMAILAQDQYAYVLTERLKGALMVWGPESIAPAHAAGRIPVLAPTRWMLAADVLPHSWDATSDSVAAFVAGAIDARLLVLIKPVAGAVDDLADAAFRSAVPAGLAVEVVGAGEIGRLAAVLARATR
jgi:aspartokinase-like uncharacterized kinase